MLTIEQIRERLQDRQLSKVAQATGLSTQTLWRIRQNKDVSVRFHTAHKLAQYFERYP